MSWAPAIRDIKQIRVPSLKQPLWLLWGVAFLFWSASGSASAAGPEVHISVSSEEVFIGDTIDYQVEIRNVENPTAPDLSSFKDNFDVVANGNQSRDQSSITVINGRVSKQTVLSHIYLYRLTPKAAGDLTIPSPKVTVDGKVFMGDEVEIKVVAAEEQDLVVAEITTSHPRVYPTQPFTVTLKIFVQPLPKNSSADPLSPLQRRPPHIQVNWVDLPDGLVAAEKSSWLQPMLAEDGIGFTLNDINTRSGSFFDGPRAAVFKLNKGRESRESLDGTTIKYYSYELSRTLTPDRTGLYILGPALIKGTFVTGVDRNEYTARRLVAVAPAVNLEVREIPSPRPSTYCGGIGEFQIHATASPTKLRVGDPLTLTLELEKGKQGGSLELVSAPDLSAMPQLMADFDLIDKNPTGRIEGSAKKFAYALRPKRPDIEIPVLAVSTFNTDTEEFQQIETKPIPLQVSEAERLTSGELVGNKTAMPSTTIKTRAEGIFQNVTDPSELQDQRISLLTWSEAALAVWCGAGFLIGMQSLYRRKRSDAGWLRRQQARGTAQRRLADAKSLAVQGKSAEALRQVKSAIVGLVADLRNRVAEGLTTSDVNQILLSASISDPERASILKLLESIESADYGGGQSNEPLVAIEEARKWISTVGPRLERGAVQ